MSATSALHPVSLKCNNLTSPLGISAAGAPEFSWAFEAGSGLLQSACQIRVCGENVDIEHGPWLWDSGVLESGAAAGHLYGGPALASFSIYRWQVRVRDNQGIFSAWSEEAVFETAFGSHEDWGRYETVDEWSCPG
ncbi:MAG: hypothetical protein J6S21_06035, partial [Victivallales bacterium]|nr:hypothetical protein [Victivallales bacterium]